jgi:acetyl esterase/lipase
MRRACSRIPAVFPAQLQDVTAALRWLRLADALRAAGGKVEFTEVSGGDHMWMGVPQPEGIFDAAVGFARQVTAPPADNTAL